MLFIIARLDHPASLRLVDSIAHRPSDFIAVHDHLALDMASRPTDRLNQS